MAADRCPKFRAELPGDLLELLDALEPDQPDRASLLAVALARIRPARLPPAAGLMPVTRPGLLALLQATVLRAPRHDLAHTLHRSCWRRRHQHRAATCRRRWDEITAAATR